MVFRQDETETETGWTLPQKEMNGARLLEDQKF